MPSVCMLGNSDAIKVSVCRRSDVVALVLDASECADTDAERFVITQQDYRFESRPHVQHSNMHLRHLCRASSRWHSCM